MLVCFFFSLHFSFNPIITWIDFNGSFSPLFFHFFNRHFFFSFCLLSSLLFYVFFQFRNNSIPVNHPLFHDFTVGTLEKRIKFGLFLWLFFLKIIPLDLFISLSDFLLPELDFIFISFDNFIHIYVSLLVVAFCKK